MSIKPEHDFLVEQVTTALDDSTRHMDAVTLSRLNRARQHALQHTGNRPALLGWLPATALTASMVVVLGIWLNISAPVNGLDIVEAEFIANAAALSDDDLQLLNDLEFYAWLIEQDHAS